MQILFLSRWFPFPPDNGSKLRVYNLLRGLARHHELTLLSFVDSTEEGQNSAALEPICREVQTVFRKAFDGRSRRAIAGFFAPVPRSVIDTFSREMARRIQLSLEVGRYDLIIASQEGTAAYARYFNGIPALFEEVEIAVPYEACKNAQALLPRFRRWLTWTKQRRYLARLMQHFNACTVVSEVERGLLRNAVRKTPPVAVIPNCVNLKDYTGIRASPRKNRLIYTGSFRYQPNYEAMLWFLKEVYPSVQTEIPDIELLITGDHNGRVIPATKGVTLTGRVEDVRPLVASSWVSIAPIHSGGGTRLKVLESMALGTPVVATSKGAEGLEVEAGRHLLIADTPSDFTLSLLQVLKEQKSRQELAKNALERLGELYDWRVVMPRFLELVDQVASAGLRRRGADGRYGRVVQGHPY